MKVCVISPIFGNDYRHFYKSPKGFDSFIFSNNHGIRAAAEKAGWNFVYVDLPMSNDAFESAMQSKYVKFLQFLKDDKFKSFHEYDRIICVDHKLCIKGEHVKDILKMQTLPVLIRTHSRGMMRKNIWEEVGVSMSQERYSRFARKIIRYVDEKIQSGCDENCDRFNVCTTGLACYQIKNPKVCELVDEVYNEIQTVGMPQCQIIWFMVAQKYADIIKVVDWETFDIKWRNPSDSRWIFYPFLKCRQKHNKMILRLFGIFPIFIKRLKNDQ